MSSSDTTPSPGDRLANVKHERFAVLLCGQCWGNAARAYQAAGFRCTTPESAANCASRLLADERVKARVRWLRQQSMDELGADRHFILAKRMAIVKSADTPPDLVLEALRDVEKAQGLGQPERLELAVSGTTQHVVAAVSPDSWQRLSQYIEEIRADFAASRAATPQQIAERQRRLVAQGKIPGALPPAAAGAAPAAPAAPKPQLSPAAREQLQRTVLAVPPTQGKGGPPNPTSPTR